MPDMHSVRMQKPDGRWLTLYGRHPVVVASGVRTPSVRKLVANPHLRWHPLRGEWVAYAAYRQDRTHLPPAEHNPLLPSSNETEPTELPEGQYDIAVFDNLFPTLIQTASDPPTLAIPTAPARGHCEVVVFTQDPSASLSKLELTHLELLIEVWADRTERLGGSANVQYVLPFENRGVAVGVTLHHPHGQIYAYPFVPPVAARVNEQERTFYERQGQALLETLIDSEIQQGTRIIYCGEHAVSFVPPWARYPYEVWVAPRRAAAFLHEITAAQRSDLGLALKMSLLKLDGLWGTPMPYVMAWFQAPTDGARHPEAHVHAEFYPAHRTRNKIKFLAGTEVAAGMFASDSMPEDCARELRQVTVHESALR